MSYPVATEYPHGVEGVMFAASQGAYTANSELKNGGKFASPIAPNSLVALDSDFMTVKACGAADIPIGRTIGKPLGDADGESVAVNMFCDKIMDLPLDAAGAAVAIGDYLEVGASGTFKKAATGAKTAYLALKACADPNGADKPYFIPVACGFYGEHFMYAHPTLFTKGHATGTGAEQEIVHGLGAIPGEVVLSDYLTGGALAIQTKAADATKIYVNATVAKDFVWVAFK